MKKTGTFQGTPNSRFIKRPSLAQQVAIPVVIAVGAYAAGSWGLQRISDLATSGFSAMQTLFWPVTDRGFGGYQPVTVPTDLQASLSKRQTDLHDGETTLQNALQACHDRPLDCAPIFTSLYQAVTQMKLISDPMTRAELVQAYAGIAIKRDRSGPDTVSPNDDAYKTFVKGSATTGGYAMFKAALADIVGLPNARFVGGLYFDGSNIAEVDGVKLGHAYAVVTINGKQWAMDDHVPSDVPQGTLASDEAGRQYAIDASSIESAANTINLNNSATLRPPGLRFQPVFGATTAANWAYASANALTQLDPNPPAGLNTAPSEVISLQPVLDDPSKMVAMKARLILDNAFHLRAMRDAAMAAPAPAASVTPPQPQLTRPAMRQPVRPQHTGDGTYKWIESNCRAGMKQYCSNLKGPN